MASLLTSFRAHYHLWSGRRCYRLGRMKAAGFHFQEAIASGHESFEAYLLLGKIRFRQNDFVRAAQLFERARDADPEAYMLEGFPDDFIAMLRRRPQHAGRPEYRIVIENQATARKKVPLPMGDFSSKNEMLKHRSSPPIQADDAAEIDWDAEARKLFDD